MNLPARPTSHTPGFAGWGLLSLLAVALAGCVSGPNTYSASGVGSPAARARLAGEYWSRGGLPDLRAFGYRRAAVAEFVVEFVTRKSEAPLSRQLLTQTPAPLLGGLGVKAVDFDPHVLGRLPNELLGMFVNTLAVRGFEVVAPQLVFNTRAYSRLRVQPLGQGSVLEALSPLGSDTGRVHEILVVPAAGMQVIAGASQGSVDGALRDILDEVGCDVLLRASVRVGIHGGHAAIEEGTTVQIVTRDVEGRLNARRSVVSDDIVVDLSAFEVNRGTRYTVVSGPFLGAIRRMFPAFVSMAFETGKQAR